MAFGDVKETFLRFVAEFSGEELEEGVAESAKKANAAIQREREKGAVDIARLEARLAKETSQNQRRLLEKNIEYTRALYERAMRENNAELLAQARRNISALEDDYANLRKREAADERARRWGGMASTGMRRGGMAIAGATMGRFVMGARSGFSEFEQNEIVGAALSRRLRARGNVTEVVRGAAQYGNVSVAEAMRLGGVLEGAGGAGTFSFGALKGGIRTSRMLGVDRGQLLGAMGTIGRTGAGGAEGALSKIVHLLEVAGKETKASAAEQIAALESLVTINSSMRLEMGGESKGLMADMLGRLGKQYAGLAGSRGAAFLSRVGQGIMKGGPMMESAMFQYGGVTDVYELQTELEKGITPRTLYALQQMAQKEGIKPTALALKEEWGTGLSQGAAFLKDLVGRKSTVEGGIGRLTEPEYKKAKESLEALGGAGDDLEKTMSAMQRAFEGVGKDLWESGIVRRYRGMFGDKGGAYATAAVGGAVGMGMMATSQSIGTAVGLFIASSAGAAAIAAAVGVAAVAWTAMEFGKYAKAHVMEQEAYAQQKKVVNRVQTKLDQKRREEDPIMAFHIGRGRNAFGTGVNDRSRFTTLATNLESSLGYRGIDKGVGRREMGEVMDIVTEQTAANLNQDIIATAMSKLTSELSSSNEKFSKDISDTFEKYIQKIINERVNSGLKPYGPYGTKGDD